MRSAKVISHEKDDTRNVIYVMKYNPFLDNRVYDVVFPDGAAVC